MVKFLSEFNYFEGNSIIENHIFRKEFRVEDPVLVTCPFSWHSLKA